MNLLTAMRRALSPADFGIPADFDPFLGMYAINGRPANGQYEFPAGDLDAIVERILKRSGPVWALCMLRMQTFSEARLTWQQINNGRPGDLFGNPDLALFEHPWPGAVTGDLLSRMLLDVDALGNAFVTDRTLDPETGLTVRGDRLKRLRPDWVTTIYGSNADPGMFGDALDGELIAYVYTPRTTGGTEGVGTVLMPDEVAHFAPYPDPQAMHRGMSWLTPVIREVEADDAAVIHKGAFFKNGATPKLAMKVDPSISKPKFQALVQAMESAHAGPWNAYKTLYVGGGADPVPLTFSLKDLDYSTVLASGESRLAAAAGVPSIIAGFSDGLKGSGALIGTSTYGPALKRFVDLTIRPLWRNACGSLETLVTNPNGGRSRLWYDTRDVAFMREDEKEAADVRSKDAATIKQLIDAGFEPEAAVAAVRTGDFALLDGKHTGLFSVQLQPPANGDLDAEGEPEAAPTTGDDAPVEGATDTSGQEVAQ